MMYASTILTGDYQKVRWRDMPKEFSCIVWEEGGRRWFGGIFTQSLVAAFRDKDTQRMVKHGALYLVRVKLKCV